MRDRQTDRQILRRNVGFVLGSQLSSGDEGDGQPEAHNCGNQEGAWSSMKDKSLRYPRFRDFISNVKSYFPSVKF